MPAVVRGGRRQSAAQASRASSSNRKGGGNSARSARPAPATPGKLAAFGRVDASPVVVGACLAAGVVLLGAIMVTGERGARAGEFLHGRLSAATGAMGFKLLRVHVTGASPEAEAAVQQALSLSQGQSLIGIDLAAIRSDVEAVGWIKEARVVRLLPDTLIVDVREHDRLAVWQTGGRAYVIDAEGRVIPDADAGRFPQLPLIVGPGAEQAAAAILPLVRSRPRLMNRVEALVRVDQRRWDLRLKDGALIQLPAMNEEAALIRLDEIDARERLLDLGFSRVDLRTPEAVAVRPVGV